jgi:hypothetical protein
MSSKIVKRNKNTKDYIYFIDISKKLPLKLYNFIIMSKLNYKVAKVNLKY